MSTKKNLLIMIISLWSLSSLQSFAVEIKSESLSLKQIMQGLLESTKQLTEGIINEDYLLIEKAALQIANHPKAPIETRKKLAKSFGKEMLNFKGYDMKVHGSALHISQISKKQSMNEILSNYQTIIDNCHACHHQFRQSAMTILK